MTTDGSGNASFDEVLPVTIAAGELVTSTATDPGGNTSEFSQQLVFTGAPPLGPAAGGTVTTLKGMLFEDGATVTVGGVVSTTATLNWQVESLPDVSLAVQSTGVSPRLKVEPEGGTLPTDTEPQLSLAVALP